MDSSPFLMCHAFIRSSMACLMASDRKPTESNKEGWFTFLLELFCNHLIHRHGYLLSLLLPLGIFQLFQYGR